MTTPTNYPARDATAAELVKYRSESTSVFTARINQTFSTLDDVIEFLYDGSVGNVGDVKAGARCYIGTTAGAHDKGVCHIRISPDGTKIYINPTSSIAFADNDYVTIFTKSGQGSKLGIAIQHPATI